MFIFVCHANFIYKSINDYITNELTDIIEITDDIFSDDMVSFVILSIILFPIESVFRHQQNILSVIHNILVMVDKFFIKEKSDKKINGVA